MVLLAVMADLTTETLTFVVMAVKARGMIVRTSCCYTMPYNENIQICCNRKVSPKNDTLSCCFGHTLYNLNTHICRYVAGYGIVKQRNGSTSYCGSVLYNLKSHICCNGRVSSRNASTSCCDGIFYNKNTQMCCNNRLSVQNGNMSCCYGIPYNVYSHICCFGRTGIYTEW